MVRVTAILPADVHHALQQLDMTDWPVIQCHPTVPRQTPEERDRDVDHVLHRHLEAAVGFIKAGRTARACMELDQGVTLAARILGEESR